MHAAGIYSDLGWASQGIYLQERKSKGVRSSASLQNMWGAAEVVFSHSSSSSEVFSHSPHFSRGLTKRTKEASIPSTQNTSPTYDVDLGPKAPPERRIVGILLQHILILRTTLVSTPTRPTPSPLSVDPALKRVYRFMEETAKGEKTEKGSPPLQIDPKWYVRRVTHRLHR